MATGTEGLTVIVYVRVAVRPRTSVALNVTVLVPAFVGVPVMSAKVSCSGVLGRGIGVGCGTVMVKPAGSVPETICQLSGPMEPAKLTVLELTTVPTWKGPSSARSGRIAA